MQDWKQGRSDGGGDIGIYPPKSAQVNFLWGKNDIRTAIQQFYTPQKKTLYPQNQISGYAPDWNTNYIFSSRISSPAFSNFWQSVARSLHEVSDHHAKWTKTEGGSWVRLAQVAKTLQSCRWWIYWLKAMVPITKQTSNLNTMAESSAGRLHLGNMTWTFDPET